MSDAERWQRIKAIFQAAVEKAPTERAGFLAAAAADDDGLRREVESLVAADAHSLELDDLGPDSRSANAVLPGDLDRRALTAGGRIGGYEVVGPLGAGSMGEVYRARDTKLNRDVALKIVPHLVAADPGQLTHVAREAQLLASLNHPHIGAIYGLEEWQGAQILVLELIDGPTLAERIEQGPLSVAEAVVIASQVAEALAAAHAKGIVHRDLKPANVKLATNNAVKVLDFGLAKGIRTSDDPGRGGAAAVEQADSGVGAIVGSPAYMSPEQARGERVDVRTDIWAFGCLLYELLTGKRAFAAKSVSETLAAVREREPDWTAVPASTPPGVRTLLRRCLEKEPDRRPQTIEDIRQLIAVAPPRMRRRCPSRCSRPATRVASSGRSRIETERWGEIAPS